MIDKLKNKFENFKPYINGHEEMKRASVLIPIVKKDDEYFILFEVRSKHLRKQPNEICFPGGKIDLNETPREACIRETCEELGVHKDNVEIISSLDLLITPSDFIIHPYLGHIDDIDNLHINKEEVDHTFLVPVSYLLDNLPLSYNNKLKVIPADDFPYEMTPTKENYKFASGNYSVLFYEYNGYIIWGITAKILSNFLNIIKY